MWGMGNSTSPSASAITKALKDYDAWLDEHPAAERETKELVAAALDDAGISFDQVSVRLKDRSSFVAKLKNPAYPEYQDFASAHDIVGIRVTTFHSAEIEQLLAAVSTIFAIDTVVDKAAETAKSGQFGYASHHVIGHSSQLGRRVEVQLRTVLQHAWAEFEHDMRYKNPEMSGNPEVDRAFTLAAGLIELADEQFDKIARIVDARTLEQDATELDTRSLPGLLTRLLGSSYPTSRADYYGWAIAMLAAHGITTVAELKELLDPDRIAALNEAMAYPFEPGRVRFIDDLLLFTYGRDHIRRTVHIGENIETRPGRLGNRWQQLGQRVYSPAARR
ncbi:GTP pyrophosphokinase [Corynebacterium urealyticum]|uniref:RelA/SpoT domain-containing protein n=1 Tax=Corynebacterium urealyticum (strain ATCC 43042 / DSM 7109) TaxID=504474 RepID=B1VHA1_CORU7|nr:hypothetical protein [Corynebacterium urealyticum]QQC41434.1 hypothetical protein I6H51_06830 [Corynebacterium urealyticum]CAQ05142.1 conserved hypothetical protein [Corynebacterium urealyticum DSM 7109]SNV85842.1 RelA/SpoT domain-containing protein [Corynebacterium urealyticum]